MAAGQGEQGGLAVTGSGFERLLYTDCQAGQGRRGSTGFQIQAQSEGVDRQQEQLAVNSLLYAIQDTWIAQGLPPQDFPRGFAHSADAGYGTAQSLYLGREVNGARQGNHLADCLLTRNAQSYGAVRPAQLWHSPLWREVAWPQTTCPAFDDYLEPGPLDIDAVASWVSHLSSAEPLAQLLSVLEQPDGRKVLLLAETPQEAMSWIAAATVLLPMRTALEISFKVFVDRPTHASQRICAFPRAFGRRLPVEAEQHRFVLDTVEETCSEQEISPRAAFWVARLASAEDPYRVLEAVEFAELLAETTQAIQTTGTGPETPAQADARQTAWALSTPEDRCWEPPG